MNHLISIEHIKCAKYGILNKVIDVTDKIKKYLNDNEFFNLSDLFPCNNPHAEKMYMLIIYLINGNKINVMHGSRVSKELIVENKIINNNSHINNLNVEQILQISSINNYILSTNARDEKNILEWIIYHLLIGFNKIVIIDHKSTKPIIDLIQPFEWKNKVHIIRREDEGAVKMMFLNNIIMPYMMINCNKYFIHLDADEYIYINEKNIEIFLSKYNADILTLNWLMFGSNNITTNTHANNFLIPIFTKSNKNIDSHFKCFIKINKNRPFIFTSPHTIAYTKQSETLYTNVMNTKRKYHNPLQIKDELAINQEIDKIPAYINHYYVQSKEDYMNRKVNRNRDDINETRTIDNDTLLLYNDIINKNIYNYTLYIEKIINNVKTFGFIIIRYVKCNETNKAWIRCYNSIRHFYNNKIVIIDDNSDKQFLVDYPTTNTIIINSEFPKRGELLPYYYLIKHKFFYRAVILHDSMEIIKYYNFMDINGYKNYTRLFSFSNAAYNIDIEYFKEMCNYINLGNLLYKYHQTNINSLIGCFGVCYVIDTDFLHHIQNKYNIINLVKFIDNRKKRMNLERFLSCLFEFTRGKSFITNDSLFGDIHRNKEEYIKKYFYGR